MSWLEMISYGIPQHSINNYVFAVWITNLPLYFIDSLKALVYDDDISKLKKRQKHVGVVKKEKKYSINFLLVF